ncbi:MAG: LysM peptidoglycan-binding domain-containing protein [Gammaproteobacteria bacterium]|nr:LysM peptidoglycan-binding domain-containing protein [Gammaproteobacteria bacterium]
MRRIIITIALFLAACANPPARIDANGGLSSARPPDPLRPGREWEAGIPGTGSPETHAALQPREYGGTKTNVWVRIQSALSLDRRLDQKAVRDKLAWFSRNQEYLDRVAERARPYLYYIVEELDRRGMPLDLALLPIIESAYHPFALSPSRASGIWQFIPSTGKRYGLKQNWWYDGRRDIIAATGAALDYLQKLHAEFDGDWLLAVAAYNAGELNVTRAINRNRNTGRKADFWSLDLPRETRGYVPSFLAVVELAAQPDHYGIALRPIANAPYFSRVDLDGQLDLATAAALAAISMDELYTLNPGFNQWATDPEGPHTLLLPLAKTEEFKRGLSSLPAEERIRWTRHEIRAGETLGEIASRYRTSVEALQAANGLRTNLIRTGHSLLIPNAQQPEAHYTLSADNRGFRVAARATLRQAARHVVTRGDTLWDISRRYGVSIADLCAWNDITPKALLRLGQKLELHPERDQPAAVHVGMAAASAEPISYTVQRGDSLWQISRRFGVTVSQLLQWNGLNEGSRLQPGQILVLHRSSLTATGA